MSAKTKFDENTFTKKFGNGFAPSVEYFREMLDAYQALEQKLAVAENTLKSVNVFIELQPIDIIINSKYCDDPYMALGLIKNSIMEALALVNADRGEK